MAQSLAKVLVHLIFSVGLMPKRPRFVRPFQGKGEWEAFDTPGVARG